MLLLSLMNNIVWQIINSCNLLQKQNNTGLDIINQQHTLKIQLENLNIKMILCITTVQPFPKNQIKQ